MGGLKFGRSVAQRSDHEQPKAVLRVGAGWDRPLPQWGYRGITPNNFWNSELPHIFLNAFPKKETGFLQTVLLLQNWNNFLFNFFIEFDPKLVKKLADYLFLVRCN